MPTYDYKCLVCSHSFELFQPMSAESVKNCPECNGEVKRLIGAGLRPIFKGKGFYQTDYKSSTEPKSSSGDENKKPAAAKETKKDSSSSAA